MQAVLTLYGREYCGLCQQMLAELRPLAAALDFRLDWFDIDDDDEIEARYDTMVPVLVGEGGEVVCFYHLNRRALDAYLGKIR